MTLVERPLGVEETHSGERSGKLKDVGRLPLSLLVLLLLLLMYSSIVREIRTTLTIKFYSFGFSGSFRRVPVGPDPLTVSTLSSVWVGSEEGKGCYDGTGVGDGVGRPPRSRGRRVGKDLETEGVRPSHSSRSRSRVPFESSFE